MRIVADDGTDLAPDAQRWLAEPDVDDLVAIDGLDDPVLDIGCGPGRIVAHLASRGVRALGVDVHDGAVAATRRRGGPVLRRSVFDPLPGEGRWGGAVLLDGNIGIDGDPVRLLARVRGLLRPGGRTVAEVAPPGTPSSSTRARVTVEDEPGHWFDWAVVSADAIDDVAADAGLVPTSVVTSGDRWFALLHKT